MIGEQVHDFARRMAIEKAIAGYQLAKESEVWILASDTCGEIAGELLGKPTDYADAQRLLGLLSGATHEIHTAYALYDGQTMTAGVVTSTVTMRALSAAEIQRYWQTGEPADKAGAYAIQGIGGQFVQHLNGSYSAVMGLPLFEVAQLLNQQGIETL